MMRAIHPGEILKEEFMTPMKLSANALANALDVPTNRITAIINETRGITGDTALRLAAYFDTTPQFWMNMQQSFELKNAAKELPQSVFKSIRKHSAEFETV